MIYPNGYNPLRLWDTVRGPQRKQFLTPHHGGGEQWMVDFWWLQELNGAPENIKRQRGRRKMGTEW